jgi:hypothetical protein
MEAAWSAAGGPPVGFYNGAWIGLSSDTAVRTSLLSRPVCPRLTRAHDCAARRTVQIPANVAANGPWAPATNWRWANGTSQDGPLITAYMESKWGAVGTGWQRDGIQRGQPDNSGGRQRCVLIAIGVNALPITDDECARTFSAFARAREHTHTHVRGARAPLHNA